MCVFYREVVCGAYKTVKMGSQIAIKSKLMKLYLKVCLKNSMHLYFQNLLPVSCVFFHSSPS